MFGRLYVYGGADTAGIAEHTQITLDLGCRSGGLLGIIRQLARGPAVDRRHLADQRDRIEIGRTVRRAADEIVGEVGAPAERDADASGKMPVGLLDRADIHAVGKHQKLLAGIAALL